MPDPNVWCCILLFLCTLGRTQQHLTVDFPRLSWNRHRRFLTSFFLGYHGDLLRANFRPSAARQACAFSPRRHASSPLTVTLERVVAEFVCKSPGFPSNRVAAGQVDPPAVRMGHLRIRHLARTNRNAAGVVRIVRVKGRTCSA